MKQQGITPVILTIIIAVILIPLSAFLYFNKTVNKSKIPSTSVISTPSPTPSLINTTEWKTYTDPNNEFSFKYPGIWYYTNIPNTAYFEDQVHFYNITDSPQPALLNYKNAPPIPLQIAIRTDTTYEDLKSQLNLKPSDTSINGKPTLKYATGVYIQIGTSSKRLLWVERNQYPDKEGYLDTILSSLKFTDSASPSPTSNLKTCLSDADCSSSETCTAPGPIAIDPVTKKTLTQKSCYPKNQVLPY